MQWLKSWFTATEDLVDVVYPVGSIYMSVNSTSPATLFGGTWQKIEDKFLLASGTSYSNGATGGEAEHTLTIAEMPTHHHKTGSRQTYGSGSTWGLINYGSSVSTQDRDTSSTGGGQAHNNMPPYLVVNVWKRTA